MPAALADSATADSSAGPATALAALDVSASKAKRWTGTFVAR